jgi:hypothetical protein
LKPRFRLPPAVPYSEVDDHIAKCNIKLTDEVEMKLTEDEKIGHSNAWRIHR